MVGDTLMSDERVTDLPRDGTVLIYPVMGGALYGFPKVYNPREGETLRDWIVRQGYPRKYLLEQSALTEASFSELNQFRVFYFNKDEKNG